MPGLLGGTEAGVCGNLEDLLLLISKSPLIFGHT